MSKKKKKTLQKQELINNFNNFAIPIDLISNFLPLLHYYTLSVVQQLLISYLLRAVSKCTCWRAIPVSFGVTIIRLCRRLQTADRSAGVTTAHCLDIADVAESCWLGDAAVVVSLWPKKCLNNNKKKNTKRCRVVTENNLISIFQKISGFVLYLEQYILERKKHQIQESVI